MPRSVSIAVAVLCSCAIAHAQTPPGEPIAAPATSSATAPVPAPAPPPVAAPTPPVPAPAPVAPSPAPVTEPGPPAPIQKLPFLLLAAELGFERFSPAELAGSGQSFLAIDGSDTRVFVGAAASVWLHPWTLGVRARLGHVSTSNYWNVGPEVGVRLPYGPWEPYGSLGVGYASISGLGSGPPAAGPQLAGPTGSIAAHGYDARLAGGIDYRTAPHLSFGLLLGAEVVRMSYSLEGVGDAATTGLAVSLSFVVGAAL